MPRRAASRAVGRNGEPAGGGASRSGWDCLVFVCPLAVIGTSIRVVVRRVAISARRRWAVSKAVQEVVRKWSRRNMYASRSALVRENLAV